MVTMPISAGISRDATNDFTAASFLQMNLYQRVLIQKERNCLGRKWLMGEIFCHHANLPTHTVEKIHSSDYKFRPTDC